MKKTIILHIGPPKTGSTSIQDLMANNWESLNHAGILYPNTSRFLDGSCYQVKRPEGIRETCGPMNSHQFLAWSLLNEVENFEAKSCWDSLLKEINDFTGDTVVISSEAFSRLNRPQIEFVKEALSSFEIKIIAYDRQVLPLQLSHYTQHVKMGRCSTSFRTFIKNNPFNTLEYSTMVDTWSEVFEDSSIHTKNFDNLIGNLETDFLKFIGLSEEQIERIPIKGIKNKSPSPSIIRLLCTINWLEQKIGKPQSTLGFFMRMRKRILMNPNLPLLSHTPLNKPLWSPEDRTFLEG